MSEAKPGETCADCPWFGDDTGSPWGRCRRYPPQFTNDVVVEFMWEYPRAHREMPSCGEHPRHPARCPPQGDGPAALPLNGAALPTTIA